MDDRHIKGTDVLLLTGHDVIDGHVIDSRDATDTGCNILIHPDKCTNSVAHASLEMRFCVCLIKVAVEHWNLEEVDGRGGCAGTVTEITV